MCVFAARWCETECPAVARVADTCAIRPSGTGEPAPSRMRRRTSVRVVVTGATGNVGTAVVDALRGDAAVTEVVGIARRAPDRMPPKTRFVPADVAEEDLTPH